jgi:hypothetical protein
LVISCAAEATLPLCIYTLYNSVNKTQASILSSSFCYLHFLLAILDNTETLLHKPHDGKENIRDEQGKGDKEGGQGGGGMEDEFECMVIE